MKNIYRRPKEPFSKEKHLLHFKGRLCIPKGNFSKDLLHDHHKIPITGHLGARETYLRIRPHYYWKGLQKIVEEYVAGCRTCRETNAQNHKPFGFLQSLEAPQSRWTHITMDFVTPIPLPPNADAPCVAKLFRNQVYRHHGLPQSIFSDRDPISMGKFWSYSFKILGTKLSPYSTYHPQTDGQTEVINRKVEEMIRAFVNYD